MFYFIASILSLAFFIFLNLELIDMFILSANEIRLSDFLLFIMLELSLIVLTLFHFIKISNIRKNYFLDNYIFPDELFNILSEKYPHLQKEEIEEVLKFVKEFYRFQINTDTSISSYMPSRVVDFACQTFFDMPSSSLFFKKFLASDTKYHRILPKGITSPSKEAIVVLLSGQDEKHNQISKMWCYSCKKENIDPFFPLSFPSFFTLDKRLKIPLGFIYELNETLFRETHPLSQALSLTNLKNEIKEIEDIDYLAKKILYYLSSYHYCYQYQEYDLEKLFELIFKNESLTNAIDSQCNDINLFRRTVLKNSAPYDG